MKDVFHIAMVSHSFLGDPAHADQMLAGPSALKPTLNRYSWALVSLDKPVWSIGPSPALRSQKILGPDVAQKPDPNQN